MLIAIEPLLILLSLSLSIPLKCPLSFRVVCFFIPFIELMETNKDYYYYYKNLFQSVYQLLFSTGTEHDWIFHLRSYFLSGFLIKIANTLYSFKLINTWWIFTRFTNWIYDVKLIDDELLM